MCDAKKTEVMPAPVAAAMDSQDGCYIVVRDVTTADLHIKGQFMTAAEASELADEFAAEGRVAAIAFIPNTPPALGRTTRNVAAVALATPTVDVLVLS